jgi:spermidine synthase
MGMRKYHGTVIHRSQDGRGTIEVVDDGHTRSLHFGNAVRQSATDLSRPEYLVLTYTRAMMSSLLFKPSPCRVLLIGLGGGSLAKFLLHHFPHCSIDAVEHRDLVVKLAHGYFSLPEDQRLRIHVMDGADFVQSMASVSSGCYDLILIDAYDNAGMDDNMGEKLFIRACYALLSADGLLAINLWGRDQPRYNQVLRTLQQCFAAKPLLLPSEGTTNVIAMALHQTNHRSLLKTAEARAKALEDQTGLELVRFSRALRKQNGSLAHRLFS